MTTQEISDYSAFEGNRLLSCGDLPTVVRAAKLALDAVPQTSILIFEDSTSQQIEIDFRGDVTAVLSRLAPPSTTDASTVESATDTKPGRPRLGVVAREVTLLPRHWEWLGAQTGGASVTLRKLVETARRDGEAQQKQRQTQEAMGRFMMVMAGNFPGFEEASRALYRGERERFEALIAGWPSDVRAHLHKLAQGVVWESDRREASEN